MISGCDFFFGGISCSVTWAQTDFQTAALVSSKGPKSTRLRSPLAVSSSWQSKQLILEKALGEVLEVATDWLSRYIRNSSLGSGAEQDKDRHPEGEGQLGHAKISFRGPVPESNLAANCSDMLKRSHSTPEARRMDV